MRGMLAGDRLPLWRLTLLIAVVAISLMIYGNWQNILDFAFRDPDDALRLVQVRDFLAGQSWFDVSQHRINPPAGGDMHWSRLVDLPIAGLILLFRPLVGPVGADWLALVFTPLLLFTALLFSVAMAVRRLAGDRPACVAVVLAACSFPILFQFWPMRIDHHGWQILTAAIALWATFDRAEGRGGLVAGLSVALWMHISTEGLPYALLFGGLYALAFVRSPFAGARFAAFMAALTVGSGLLLLGTRGWPVSGVSHCDAMSPVYLLPIALSALAMLAGWRLAGTRSWARRCVILGLGGAAGVAAFALMGGACLAGPFESLDPLVYDQWYMKILEGRPVWEQKPMVIGLLIVPPLVGLAGALMAVRAAADEDDRVRWIGMLLLALGAYAISLAVMRAVSISYLYALPGAAWLAVHLMPKARAILSAPRRIVATLAVFALTPVGLSILVSFALSPLVADSDKAADKNCKVRGHLQGLRALPAGTILAPLDIGPDLLAGTPHGVVATGHHRNHLAMKQVILAFTGPADRAEGIAVRQGARYLAYCPGEIETGNYQVVAPEGLMSQLEQDRPPPWLERLPMPAGETIRVYRVKAVR